MAETIKKERQKRIPFGTKTSKLELAIKDPAYHYRYFNDSPGRIQRALDAGYTFVEPEEVGKDPREGREENKVAIYAGTQTDGVTPLYSYLMKIPMEFYLEDDAVKNLNLDSIDAAIKGGKIDQTAGDNRYIPKEGISIKTK